jgi:protocatechuate 3,4-dioxygenase beta subunit
MGFMRNTLRVLVCALVCATALLANSAHVVLNGRVTDTASAPLAGAIVTVCGEQGAVTSMETDTRGEYSFVALRPGNYTVRVTLPGHAMYENRAVKVTATHPQILNVRLAGQLTVSVSELKAR